MLSSINSSLASAWANSLFAKLDTQNQGYIDKTGLESAFSKIPDRSDSSASVDDIFTRLDSNNDSRVTKDEMATYFKTSFDQIKSQTNLNRMHGCGGGGPSGPGGMPPPPQQNANDTGFTKNELTGQLEEICSSDTKRAALISKIIENFDAADSNGDGKVSLQEAMAYDKANQTDTSAATAPSKAVSAADNQSSEATIMMQIMKLMQAYQVFEEGSNQSGGATAQLSVSA
jgi:Ca2+-binding EF-hand superfamily protein